jgi:hypothetical protein
MLIGRTLVHDCSCSFITSDGKTTQSSADRVHMWTVGLIELGSSNVPPAIPRQPGLFSAFPVTVTPQLPSSLFQCQVIDFTSQ